MVKIAAMMALEVFASKTPPSHRTVLPLCVPKESQLLLQARLKGHIFSWENRTVIPMVSGTVFAHIEEMNITNP